MSKTRRKMFALCSLFGGATVFQVLPGTCAESILYQGLSALDFCAVLNCTGGSFFNFCNPIVLFIDCL